jgi:molybdenum cofactor cytidylyltransferase
MITGIILASGLSRRMGSDKLLLPVDGIAIVERVMQAADASLLDDIAMVYQNPAVCALAERYRIRPVYNPDAARGQSAAIKAGVLAALPRTQAYMFLTGDQPFITVGIINLLVATWRENPADIIVPVYGSRRGGPVIFPSTMTPELLALDGDTGGRAIIEQVPDMIRCISMPDSDAGRDIDTPLDYEHCTHGRKY